MKTNKTHSESRVHTHRCNKMRKHIIVGLLAALAAANPSSYAAIDTWTGSGGSGLFSDSANWTGGSATPISNDTLVFGSTTGTTTLTNNLPVNPALGGITFNADAPAYTIEGAMSLASVNPLTVFTVNSASNITQVINGNFLGLQIRGISVVGSGNLTLTGTISRGGTYSPKIEMNGTGVLTLSGTNTNPGVVTFANGTVSVGTIGNGGVASNLGASSAAATSLVFSGGKLKYTGANTTSNRAFTINANTSGTIETANNLSLAGATGTATNGSFIKTGSGILTLTGVNTNTGSTTVSEGTLALIGTGSISASSPLIVASGSIFDTTGVTTAGTLGSTTISVGTSSNGVLNLKSGTTYANALTIDFGSTLTLANSYNLFTSNLAGHIGNFSTVTATGTSISGTFVYSGGPDDTWTLNTGNYNLVLSENLGTLTASAVPEPATYAAFAGLLVLGLTVVQRRRQSAKAM